MYKHAHTRMPIVLSDNRSVVEEAIRNAGFRLGRGEHGSLRLINTTGMLLGIIWICNTPRTISIKQEGTNISIDMIKKLERQFLFVKIK